MLWEKEKNEYCGLQLAILSQEKGFKSFRIYGYTDKIGNIPNHGMDSDRGKNTNRPKKKNSGKSAGKEEQHRTLENFKWLSSHVWFIMCVLGTTDGFEQCFVSNILED